MLPHSAAGPIDFCVEPGQIAVVCGPVGIGKTTLLRTLLGLELPRAGTIAYGGRALAGVGPRARPFAWAPQEAPVLADTLEANVRLADEASSAEDALAAIGALHVAETMGGARLGAARAPSGGERQWISLARAVATRQPVLVLDEPTSGLDARAQDAVLAAIARMRGRRSVLLVTHRPEPLPIADVLIRLGEPRRVAPARCHSA
jgi:ABC-type transport system involved in cytochrome bd biosynthesis fused ATPase/permease subunit